MGAGFENCAGSLSFISKIIRRLAKRDGGFSAPFFKVRICPAACVPPKGEMSAAYTLR
jgi:hypothetical protein